MNHGAMNESAWRLRWDLWSVKLLLRLAHASGRGQPRPEVHRFLADRYARLAGCHQRAGHSDRARRLRAMSARHLEMGGDDGPPYAAAMATPRPRGPVVVDAVGRHVTGPDDAA
jgi:hypothetical protein